MTRDAPPSDRIVLAQIGAPHGVSGEVRLKVFAEDPASLKGRTLDLPDGRGVRITHLRPLKGEMHVARLDGVDDRDAAEALRLKLLDVPRDALPALDDADDFYIADLVGLDVRDGDGTPIGRVLSVQDFGAGDILEVRHASTPDDTGGRDQFYAFTRAQVPEIDIAAGWLMLVPQAETDADVEGEDTGEREDERA